MATGGRLRGRPGRRVHAPSANRSPRSAPGEIGYITAGIKTVADCKVGDTITEDRRRTAAPLPGFQPSLPVVFCGIFPVDTGEFEHLRESLEKLALNDSSFHTEPETSAALGYGFRCGFLGLLHLEIVQERLAREFDLDLITTAPSVVYRLHMNDGTQRELHNPVDMPDETRIAAIEEPWIRATILTPDDYLGAVLALCTERRGEQIDLTYAGSRAMAVYRLPLNEVVYDFYDRLKSVTRGYASFDYRMDGYREGDLVKVQILVNGEPVDALSMIVPRLAAEQRGRAICGRLKELIPRQLFKIPIQAAIGGKGRRARDHLRPAERRDRQMLWRRHHPQAQAAGEAEGRQEEDAPVRQGRHPPERLHRSAQDGGGLMALRVVMRRRSAAVL